MVGNTEYTNRLISSLQIGEQYTSSQIAAFLGVEYSSILRKGVITKSGENLLILLINLKKNIDATQYIDHVDLVNSILFWEGQKQNQYAEKYIRSGAYEVFVFVHDITKTPYTYYGRAVPIRQFMMPKGTPCKTVFSLYEYSNEKPTINERTSLLMDNGIPYSVPQHTDKERTIIARTAQGQYREKALELWGNECAVSEVSNPRILIASHIKPWRESSNEERVDPYNSLILSPNYDKLFDLGYISFKPSNGQIMLSDHLSSSDWDKLHIDDSQSLRQVPNKTDMYLHYHNNYIFNFNPEQASIDQFLCV